MWILFNGLNTGDSFRIEVVCHVEYVPTLPFGAWSPPSTPILDQSYMAQFMKSVRGILPEVVNGDLGRKVSGAMEVGRKLGSVF